MRHLILVLLTFVVLLPLLAIGQASGEAALADKYFEEGEYTSALSLYQKVIRKDQKNKHLIYRIVACHSYLDEFDDGLKFLDKRIKKNELAYDLLILKSGLLSRKGKQKDADKIVNDIIYKKLKAQDEFARVSMFFEGLGNNSRALETLLQARKALRNDGLYIEKVSELYILAGEFGKATQEYLNKYKLNPASLKSVRMDILNITGPSTQDKIESVLLSEVQRESKDRGIRSIVYEFYVLTENFYEAFLQVKSIDKVFKENGDRVYKFALTMRSNKNYKLSNKALQYIIEDHEKSPYFFLAYKERAVNSELQAFETLPLDTNAVKDAVISYSELLNRFGRKPSFFDAMFRKAKLTAFYLHDLDAATAELAQLSRIPIKSKEKAQTSLLLGDILLMQKEFNKAKLKYAEVAVDYKDEQLGALAKYKEGQLAYYKGDFEYSQARLKTIKDNTTNDISNDAIQLNMLIQDNIGLDTTTVALARFANAQLLIYQREYVAAETILDSVLYNFPNHTLTDEILWEKAGIYQSRGNFDKMILFLDKIIEGHPEDIIADDALFKKARLFDYSLKNEEKAMTLYLQMLREYPGSLHSVDVRKRIREIRKKLYSQPAEGGIPRG